MTEIYVPRPVYDYWPAFCLFIACGYGLMGVPLVASALVMYVGWVWYKRLIEE